MIRINKNLVIFVSLIFFVGGSVLVSLQKLSPLLSLTIYYCQSFINSLSLPIPYYLAILPFLFVFAALLIAVLRLSVIYIKVQHLRKKLIANVQSNVRLNNLLRKLALVDKTYLIESDKQFAFCLGIRKPRIYISTILVNALTIQELESVLRHERYHLNNRDTLTMLIASIGGSLLPFFPLFSDFLKNFRVEREIEADKEAIRGLGDPYPLICVLKKFLTAPSFDTAAASAIADDDTLESRIKALVKKDYRLKKFKVKHIIMSLVSTFIMSIIFLAPVQTVAISHLREDVMMVCPNNNECSKTCRQKYSANKKNYSEDAMYTPMNYTLK